MAKVNYRTSILLMVLPDGCLINKTNCWENILRTFHEDVGTIDIEWKVAPVNEYVVAETITVIFYDETDNQPEYKEIHDVEELAITEIATKLKSIINRKQ